MKTPIALQLYSVRDYLEKDFFGTLRKVKSFGYDGVEFAGLYDNDPLEIKKVCEEIGLNPISAHVPFDDMLNDLEILKDYKTIGCKYIVIPYLLEEYRPGGPKYAKFLDGVKTISKEANKLGMKLAYHNHDFEFEKIDCEYALDIIYNDIPSFELQAQLDTCWINVGGENPIEYVKKYAGRCDLLHLKDFVGSKNENMYSLIGIKDDNEKSANSKGDFELRPVGYGVQDFPQIIVEAEKSGVIWLIVEQDNPSMEKTSLESAKMSIDYLFNF